ncbi:MAG TPA: tRNA (adenosine(37)-N6)-threonylcarbamoyltransferase complex dimerization subunit type 1 TsaB [Patescibacteria group bacterium]|jgi:tRNA threonylcarbamoyladenosine biosynthesis protein TsaB|nr:tRNA (adenosine(37)-N6)-threonylcarbamoyltransferase complex dimerization subunit type 1 TsaB [Patescibacteria group bacterium]
MILFIDTSDFNNLTLAIVNGATVKIHTASVAFNENYKTNLFLEQFLKHQKVKLESLTKVIVCSGPGSFTGIRVGVALAQALGFALKIPVLAIPKSKVPKDIRKLDSVKGTKTLVMHYGQKPNITTAKKAKK